MRTFIGLLLAAAVVISAINILSMDDAIVHLIVLGRLPGTDIQLGVGAIAILLALCAPLIAAWISSFNDQLIASKLSSMQAQALASQEASVAEEKQESVQAIARQLEIDELDVISL